MSLPKKRDSLLGCVILYGADESVSRNIEHLIPHVDFLMLIDNTEPSLSFLGLLEARYSEKIIVVANNENFGVARALNQAAAYGCANHYAWLLTMDQDSVFAEGALTLMKSFCEHADEKTGIVAPFHRTPKSADPNIKEDYTNLRITMTSGNLLNLNAYEGCGPFEEKLFIDSVDHEYCLRLRKKGYRVVRVNKAILFHALGDIVYYKFLFFRFKTTNHSATRRYYIARNRLYVMMRYASFDFKFFRRELGQYIKDFLRVIFLERQKVEKLMAIGHGTFDFLRGRFGRR